MTYKPKTKKRVVGRGLGKGYSINANKHKTKKNSQIIGQGAYGCVYKPYIPCKKRSIRLPNGSTQNLVSKFMYTNEANKELKEFKIIHQADPTNKFHLGIPTICQPDYNNKSIVADLKQCVLNETDNLYETQSDKKQFSVLTFPYGGVNLKDFVKTHLDKFTDLNKIDEFWEKCVLNLFDGLVMFRNNNIIHYDLKPHNILFDKATMSMKYIDFGMMKKRSEFISESSNNENPNAGIHWSYPFENGFVLPNVLNEYAMLSLTSKKQFAKQFQSVIVKHTKTKRGAIDIGLSIGHPDNVSYIFDFTLYKKGNKTSIAQYNKYASKEVASFFTGLDKIVATAISSDFKKNGEGQSVNKIFIEMTADAIDVYGLGFTLKYVLMAFYKKNLVSSTFFTQLSQLLETMYTMNPLERELDVKLLRDKYKQILKI